MIAATGVSALRAIDNFKIAKGIQGRLFGQQMQMTASDH